MPKGAVVVPQDSCPDNLYIIQWGECKVGPYAPCVRAPHAAVPFTALVALQFISGDSGIGRTAHLWC